MMKGDVGVDIAFTLLAGGLITKASSLCEPIKKMPGSYIIMMIYMSAAVNYVHYEMFACMNALQHALCTLCNYCSNFKLLPEVRYN